MALKFIILSLKLFRVALNDFLDEKFPVRMKSFFTLFKFFPLLFS